MDTAVLVALITAVSALLVAVITGVLQLMKTRKEKGLELQSAEQRETRRKAAEELVESQAAVRTCCVAIQRLQDELFLLGKAAPQSLLAMETRTRLIEARDGVMTAYRDLHPILAPNERTILGAVREQAVEIVLSLDLRDVWTSEFLTLDDDAIRNIERSSAGLDNYQQRLLLSSVGRIQRWLTGDEHG